MKDYIITNESVAKIIENLHISECAIDAIINAALDEEKEFVRFIDNPINKFEDIYVEYKISTKYFKKVEPEEEDTYAVVECLSYFLGVNPEELDKFITEELIPYDEMVTIRLLDPWMTEDKQYIGYDEDKKHIIFFKGKDIKQVRKDYPYAKYVPFTNEMYENFNNLVDLVEANEE